MQNSIDEIIQQQREALLRVAAIAAFASLLLVLWPFSIELFVMRLTTAFIFTGLYLFRHKLSAVVTFSVFVVLFLVNGAASGIESSSEYRSLFMFVVLSVMMAFVANRVGHAVILIGVFIAQSVVAYQIFGVDVPLMLTSALKACFICGLSFYPVKLLQDELMQKIADVHYSSAKIRSLEDRHSHEQLRILKLNENFKEFIYAISHDLRAPIRAIRGFVKMLSTDSDKKLSPQEHLYMARIEAASGRLNGMVERLTQLSRLQTNTADIVSINMTKLLSEMAGVFRKKYSTDIEFQIDNNMSMKGDVDEISMLFNELFDNACKNLQPRQPGLVCVTFTPGETESIYQVSDNGIGVATEHDLLAMTKLFRTIHVGEKSDGVGLSLAAFVVEKMGGQLEISSPGENEGTTVCIKVPTDRWECVGSKIP